MRIVSGSEDDTVRVWDSETGECLDVIPGSGDVIAIAAGISSGLPWRAIGRNQETVIEPTDGGDPVGRFPIALRNIITHPNGRDWTGGNANHLCIFTLKGEPRSVRRNDGNDG